MSFNFIFADINAYKLQTANFTNAAFVDTETDLLSLAESSKL